MLFGPIFSVELVTTARRARYLVLRILCASFLAFVLVTAYQSHLFDEPGTVVPISRLAEFARQFFIYFAFTQIVVVLLFTPALTAGTISLERERRTIEYLFATDLSNHEIVLGKLAARLVVALCLVAAGMPILSIAMLLGGIEPQWLYMALAITLSSTVALAAFGIAVSVGTKRSRDAVVRAYVLLVVVLVLPLIVSGMLMGPGIPPAMRAWIVPIIEELLDANPLVAVTRIFAPMVAKPQDWNGIGKLALYHGALAVACLMPAVAVVRRRHLKSFEVPTRSRQGGRGRTRRPIGQRPLLWKELYVGRTRSHNAWTTRLAMLLMVGAIVALTVWMTVETLEYSGFFGRGNLVEMYLRNAIPLAAALASLGILVLAAWSAAAITTEKERDTWVSLLCTPLTAREIIVGKILGNLYAARWVLLLPVIVYAPAIIFSPAFVLALLFIVGTQAILCVFVSVLGVLFSLKCRNTLRSMAGTLSVAFVLGGGYLFCCCVPRFMGSGPMGRSDVFMFTPCMPFLLAMPGALYQNFQSNRYSTDYAEMQVAYLLGMSAYVVSTIVLFFISTANFEELSGRSVPPTWLSEPRRPPPDRPPLPPNE